MPSALPAPSTAFATNAPSLPPNSTRTSDLDVSLPRRVSLQAPQDLLHLRAIALRNARAKIDLHLPPHASSQDVATSTIAAAQGADLRKDVEKYVQQFIDQTFAGVRDNVEVNGLPGSDAVDLGGDSGKQEEYEEFNGKLAAKITELHGRIERLNAEVAETRREAVGKAANDWKMEFEGWDGELSKREAELQRINETQDQGMDLEMERFKDPERTRETWEKALEGLKRLNEGGGLQDAEKKAADAARVAKAMQERG